MIKITKLPEPHILADNRIQWTADFKAAKESGADDLDEKRSRYRHPAIKEQIVNETNGKCAYCESKLRHTYPGDIEHIKPKSEFAEDIFGWDNLTLSCAECNTRKLANFDEEFGIINPYKDDPDNHLRAVGAAILPKPGDMVGKIAYELFGLNRPELIGQRLVRLENLQRLIDSYVLETNPLYKKLLKKRIEEEKASKKEYAMVARAYVRLCLREDGTPRS